MLGALLLLAGTSHAQPNLNFKRVTNNWPTIEVYFTVGCNGNIAYNMAKSDFRVLDAGVEVQDFTLWCPDPSMRWAISVALVFDASGSMGGSGNAGAKAAGHAFIDVMDGVVDEAAVLWFSQTVTVYQQMTTVKPMLHSAVDALPASGATAVWDGIYAGLIEVINNGVNPSRAVIVMTDGGDNASQRTTAEVISLAERNRIRVFTIGLGSSINATELEQIALLTGGRFYQTPNAGELAPIFQEISTILFQGFQECILSYQATCADGQYHTVELQLRDFCGGTDIKTKTYRAPLDSTTVGSVSVSLDSVFAPVPGTAVMPLRVGAMTNPSMPLPPFEATILFDTSKLAYYGLRTDSPYELNASSIQVTTVPGGIRVKSLASFARTVPVLTSLVFETKAGLASGPCAVEISDFRLASPCIVPVPGNGLVTAITGQSPSIARWPEGMLRLSCREQDSVDAAFEIRNLGSADLRIQQSSFDPPSTQKWTVVRPLGAVIKPGEASRIHLRYHAGSAGTEYYLYTIESNDPVTPSLTVPVQVVVFPNTQVGLQADPTSLDFLSVLANVEKQMSVNVRNVGTTAVNITREEIVGPDARDFRLITALPSSLGGGVQETSTIALQSDVPGEKYAEYVIHHSAGGAISIPLFGTIGDPTSELVVSPLVDTLVFAPTQANKAREITIQFMNRGGLALTVTSIGITGPQADAYLLVGNAPFTLAPGAQRSVTLRFMPPSVGMYRGTLTIHSTDPRHSVTTMQIRGEGYVAPRPRATLSANALQFGLVLVGTSARNSVRISNTGNETLQLGGQNIILDDSASYSIVDVSRTDLPPGASDSIVIAFQPMSVGRRSATLQIFSNDPDRAEIRVQLLGEGVVPPPAEIIVNPRALDFGDVAVDAASVRQLTVSNTGRSVLRILAQDITGSDGPLFRLLSPLPADIDPSKSATVSIEFSPQSTGAKSATLSIMSNDPNTPMVIVALLGNATTTSVAQSPAVPEQPVIRSAYPNPLRHTTTLRVELPRGGEGSILIHDNLGRLVRTQTTGLLGAGTNTIPVSARDLAPGTYRVTLAFEGVASAPALLVRY